MDLDRKPRAQSFSGREMPLAQMDELDALMERYQAFSDETLARWMSVVTGTHRRAMAAVLKERGQN